MRKSLYRKQASIQLENHHPGCMWGALHMLDYLAWRQVRKMLPYKRHGARRNGECQGHNGHIIRGDHVAQQDDSSVEERMTESSHHTGHSVRWNKGSVRARLKSRIVEDILRRKGKHHRSSTYPTQLKSEPSNDLNIEGKDSVQDTSANSVKSDPLPHKDTSALPLETKEDGKVQWVTFGDNLLVDNHKDHDKNETRLIQETLENAKQTLLEQKLMSDKDHNGKAPLYKSKEFLDALDLVNLDKDLLQGILQEQGSSHPFQTQQSFKKATGSSVPGSGSASPKNPELYQDASPTAVSQESPFVQIESETAGSPSSRNKEKSQVAIRHFNILRRRLRHAIKESKKEKHHVTMDGVLHKIPYGHKLSADVKEITNYWKERSAYKSKKEASPRSCGSSPIDQQKGKISHFRRTSSTGDSMEKYCWLYESSFKKKPDQPSLGNSKEINKEEQAKKSLGRILSMPDLKSYYYIPSEYLNDSYVTKSPSRSSVDSRNALSRNISFVYEPLNESKLPKSPAADELAKSLANGLAIEKINIVADAISPTLTATPTCDDLDQDFEFSFPQTAAIAFELSSSDLELLSREDLQQKDKAALADKSLRELDLKDQIYLQVDLKDDVEFKYVKNVLDLSGLSRNHPLESWHSTDQPVDPAVFEEVKGYEEGSDSYNHLILFDLINEVLMDMYEKSFSYCPVPLSSRCRLSSMPKGDRVLNEVWSKISWYFSSRPALDDKLDYVVGRDLAKSGGWMNLQFDTECIGLELEDMIFDDLLDEIAD